MKNKTFSTQNIVLMAMFVALIAICSWISIPLGPVPFTLQTFGVFITAGVLGFKRGTISVVAYVLLGTIGVPVFAGFSGGIGSIVGPTGGYKIGFIFTAIIIGLVVDYVKISKGFVKLLVVIVGMVIGDAVCFVIGTIQFMYVSDTNLATALSYCVIPFIIPDLVKIVIAAVVSDRLKNSVKLLN